VLSMVGLLALERQRFIEPDDEARTTEADHGP